MIHNPEIFRYDENITIVSPDAGGVNKSKTFKRNIEKLRQSLYNDMENKND